MLSSQLYDYKDHAFIINGMEVQFFFCSGLEI